LSTRSLVETFQTWSAQCEALVLVTVVETEGSTYSKAGRQLLMRADGTHAGLVSGGCLEGDLANHAQQVRASGESALITYDMRDDADDLWGIGLGCNGLMRLLLQRIDTEHNWQPFADMAKALADPASHTMTLATSSTLPDLPAGSCSIDGVTANNLYQWSDKVKTAPHKSPQITHHTMPEGELSVLHWQTQPWLRFLVLGAAPDALPVVRLARELGWVVTIADHRKSYLQANDFNSADEILSVNPDSISTQLSLNDFDAIIVMSHHLETDRKYLKQLSNCSAAYIGLLGPAARKHKLLNDLDAEGDDLGKRLHGPVGLDIGADSPETIALALISEIQSVISQHTGLSPD
jgi:xanthine/CO dehydrogenase XdhC/CoxF family maturation factor